MRTTKELYNNKEKPAYISLISNPESLDDEILKNRKYDNIPIVMQALSHWDGPYASASCLLAKEFSKDRMVFYVDHPFTWKDVFQNKKSDQIMNRKAIWDSYKPNYQTPFKENENFINICPQPVLPINGLKEGTLYEELKKINNKRVWKTINKVLTAYGVQEFIYINSFDPVYNECVTNKKVKLKIYHCVDNISGERYIAKHGLKAEKKAVSNADLVINTSENLKLLNKVFNPNSFLIPNGVDYENFSKHIDQIPEDIAKIKGPKVLYTGNIGLRIDYDLLWLAALKQRDFQFVFVGPMNPREFKGQTLSHLPNVHFLGPKPFSQLPAYLKAASVCIIPFLCNYLTKCIYPLKINEYLAAGKPVVASNFSDLREFKPNIQTYNNVDGFLLAIRNSIINDCSQKIINRKKIAKGNTWPKRATDFLNFIDYELEKKKLTA